MRTVDDVSDPSSGPLGSPGSPYEKFRAAAGGRVTAAQCEQWADEHPRDPDRVLALMDAGWRAARGEHYQGGDHERARSLFARAAELGGPEGRLARIGIVEMLYALDRAQEAEQTAQALLEELSTRPGEVLDDLKAFDGMVDMLGETGRCEQALDWCLAALAHPVARLDAHPGGGEAARLLRELRISRAFLRRDLGLEQDEDDLAAEAEAAAELKEVGEAFTRALDGLPSRRAVERPDDAAAFDGIVLRWVREDFAAVRACWPESTASYGNDYPVYAERLQADARTYAESGAARVHFVSATLANYLDFATREGRDADDAETRRAFSRHIVHTHPGQALAWPPPRNGPCWCESGRKYKKCCGDPAKG
ncbi:SEC-C metal-binding domain-containing protein [Streptomyces sp. NPDC005065]|uniref:SEC-C metal-binding domain-containing protein n=1 Tax=unclassified Streptomyces TaxID=2593676 RepID=UPI0033BD9A57